MTPEQRRESEIIEKVGAILSRHIVPLFIDRPDGKPQSFGAGLLVSANASSFLISAGHVFDEIREGREVYFYIEPKTKLHLSSHLHLTTIPEGKDRDRDVLNVGVLKFGDPHLPPYPAVDKWPLDVGSLAPYALPREGKTYFILGFPGSKGQRDPKKRKIESKVYSYRNFAHPTERYKKFDVKPESHIAIIFSRKQSVGPDGTPRLFPNPEGMSGSPVWLLPDELEALNDPKHILVVGVAIKHLKYQRTILATDIGEALNMIRAFQRISNDDAVLNGYRTLIPEDRAEGIRTKYRPGEHTLDELQIMIKDEITTAITEVEESWIKIANTAIANEREACAVIADEMKAELNQQPEKLQYGRTQIEVAKRIAKEIRARNNQESPIDHALRRMKERS